jgi:hypothetical protein
VTRSRIRGPRARVFVGRRRRGGGPEGDFPMSDAISLTIPHARPFQGVVRLVVGGLGARLDLPIETLEDVQLAVDTLIADDAYAAAGDVTLRVEVRAGGLDLAIGPFDHAEIESELARDVAASEGVGLGRLLGTVMGGYELEARDGHGWVRMHKPLPERQAGTAA